MAANSGVLLLEEEEEYFVSTVGNETIV